jgi:ABC-2 type transport system permease protein
MGAIQVMWLRQLKKQWRSKARLFGSLGQPLLFLLALGFGLSHVFEQAGSGSYIDFLAPGVVAMSVLFTSMFAGIEVIWDRQFGFLKETLVAPVSRFSIMIGRTLGGATISMLPGIVVFFVALLAGFKPILGLNLIVGLVFMFLVGVCFTAFGTSIASRMKDMQAFPLIINFIIMPLFFLSGALFPLEGSPAVLQAIAHVNPLAYGVDGLRAALTGVSYFGIWLDFGVLFGVTLVLFLIGAWLFEGIEA